MSNILNIFKKEIRDILRDKKSLTMMFIIPFMIPLIIIGISYLFEYQMNLGIETYNKIGVTFKLSDREEEIAKKNEINFVYGNEKELKKKYNHEEIYAYLSKEGNKYTIYYNNQKDKSSLAANLINKYLEDYKINLQKETLENNNINSQEVLNIIEIETVNFQKENFLANYIIGYTFIFIITAITTAAIYPATDSTAGEKERGTLETLLTFPIKSKDIILGKYLAIVSSSFIAGLVSLIISLISLIICQNITSIYETTNLIISGKNIFIIIFIIFMYALFISGLAIAVASRCKTFKEAQSALTPLTFIAMFPNIIIFTMQVKCTPILAITPFINYNLIIIDLVSGNINYIYVILMFVSTIIYISFIINYIIKQYQSEKILFIN